MSWLDRFRRPRRRSNYKDHGPKPFSGLHRAGTPSLTVGVGTETRPLLLPPPGKPYPGTDKSWDEVLEEFKHRGFHHENQGEGIDDRSD